MFLNINETIIITNPELLKDWDYQVNTRVYPEAITVASKKDVAWLCTCGYRYFATIQNHQDKGCPLCKG